MRRWISIIALLALFGAACSSGDDSDDSSSTEGGDTGPTTAAAHGVTDDTIKIGFTFLDLDDLREAGIISTNHGPYADHMQALVDDLNANGGIHGRMVEVVSVGYDPVGAEAQQTACIQFTEDEEVFAVLGGIRDDNVLCYTEQHDTIAIASGQMTNERLTRSAAPYATVDASMERNLTSFVDDAVEAGLLDGKTVAVHSTEPGQHALATDVLVPALEDTGIEVAFESLIEAGGADVGGAAEAAALNAEAMRGEGVDAVFVVGDTLVISNAFISGDFHPTMFYADMGSALGLSIDADLSVFDGVYAFGNYANSYRWAEPTFQEECIPVWEAAHPDDPVSNPNDIEEDDPNHTVGLGVACRALNIFVAAAEAAGPDLNNQTFLEGLESIGEFQVPGFGPASLGEDKYDAQDDLLLWVFDPDSSDDVRGFALYEG